MPHSILRNWRWAAVPFGLLYLILLALRFRGIVTAANLDADAASAPVIGQLFGSAPASAHVVLGEFGWYATLLFELGTKWLPGHRHVWEVAPYAMALAGAGLTAWAAWQAAGAFAASLTAVLLVCAAPSTLHLLLSMTQHAPDWFCLALLAAFLVLLERRATTLRWRVLVPASLAVGLVVGVNAASDPLLVICGLVPFALALVAARVLSGGPDAARASRVAAGMLLVAGLTWAGTAIAMSALHVGPEPGLQTTALASAGKLASNFRLWWQSVAVLGNGDFFGRQLTFTSGLAVVCAVLSIAAVVLLPRIGYSELRARWRRPRWPDADAQPGPPEPADDLPEVRRGRRLPTVAGGSQHAPAWLAFVVFWCSSAVLLTAAFLLSAVPVDVHADRYLVGLIYAAAAVVPAVAARRTATQLAAVTGTCLIALAGVISLAQGTVARNTEGFPPTGLAKRVAAIAAANHLTVGYAGYWDAAPITWAGHFRTNVYPVSVCDRGAHLCPFDLHYISSWYTPRPGAGSFLLADPRLRLVTAPTPDLGRPAAVYRVGRLTMYVYRYDIASRFAVT
jgi:hypothetical protein